MCHLSAWIMAIAMYETLSTLS